MRPSGEKGAGSGGLHQSEQKVTPRHTKPHESAVIESSPGKHVEQTFWEVQRADSCPVDGVAYYHNHKINR